MVKALCNVSFNTHVGSLEEKNVESRENDPLQIIVNKMEQLFSSLKVNAKVNCENKFKNYIEKLLQCNVGSWWKKTFIRVLLFF